MVAALSQHDALWVLIVLGIVAVALYIVRSAR